MTDDQIRDHIAGLLDIRSDADRAVALAAYERLVELHRTLGGADVASRRASAESHDEVIEVIVLPETTAVAAPTAPVGAVDHARVRTGHRSYASTETAVARTRHTTTGRFVDVSI